MQSLLYRQKRVQIPQNRIQTIIDAQINPILSKSFYLTLSFQCLFVNHKHNHPFCGYNSRNVVQSARKHATIHVFHKDSEHFWVATERKKMFRNPFHSNGVQRLNPQTDLSAFCTKPCIRDTRKNVTIKYLLIIVMYHSNRLIVVILSTLPFIKESLTDFSSKNFVHKSMSKIAAAIVFKNILYTNLTEWYFWALSTSK